MAWNVIDRRRLLEGAKFAVDEVALQGANGSVSRQIVVHPGAVVILPILGDGRIVLIRNERFAVGESLLELPAGTLEPGEDVARSAARELEEETGYRAAAVEPLLQFYPTPGICTELMHVFRATGLEHVGQSLEADERITVEPTAPADLAGMIRDGVVRDAKTIAVFLWHERFGAA